MDLQSQWNEMMCPLVNGITFADGTIQRLELDVLYRSGGGAKVSVTKGPLTDVSVLASLNELHWTELITLCEDVDEERDLKVLAGEGGMGADGFVALTTARDNSLRWIAFFDSSNPFKRVKLEDRQVVATSSHSNTWMFPLESPAEVSVE
jgi:hypothetical protein